MVKRSDQSPRTGKARRARPKPHAGSSRPHTPTTPTLFPTQEQLEYQAQLLNAVHDAIVATDVDGSITYWNAPAERIFGWKAEELLGQKSDETVFSERTPEQRAEHYRRLIQEHHATIAETAHRKDGLPIQIEGTAMDMRAPDGRVIGFVSAYHDVTERRRTEATIRELNVELERRVAERELKHSTILETTQSGYWLFDTQGKILQVNAAYARMSGYSQAELLQMYIQDLEANESEADILQHILLVRQRGHHQFESRHRRKDGSVFDVDIRATYLDLEGGQLVVFVWDISDRKRAEKALRESEARFRVLAEAMPQVVWSADASGAMDYYNRQTYEYGGVEPGDVQGWNWGSVIHPDDLEATLTAWHRALHTGETYIVEQRLRRADGQFRWHLTRGIPLRDDQGHITRWIGTATDMHDQKQAEEEIRRLNQTLERRAHEMELTNEELEAANEELRSANDKLQMEIAERQRIQEILRASEERYRSLVELSPDGICIHRNGSMEFVNDAGVHIFGASRPAEIIGRPILDLVHPDYRDVVQARVSEIVNHARGAPLIEEKFIRIDGSTVDVEVTAIPLPQAPGAVQVVFRDITERKRMEQTLRESEQKYRELIQYAPTGIYEVDFRTRRFVSVNDAMCLLTGYSREELLAISPFDILDDEGKTHFQARIARWLRGEKPEANVEYKVKAKDGHEIYALLDVTFTTDENGKPIGATVIGHDVTERRRTEQALRDSEERFRVVASHTPDHLLVQDRDLRYLFVINPQLGLSAEDMLGKTDYEVLGKEDADRLTKVKSKVLETATPARLELALTSRQGNLEFFDGTYVPRRDAKGQIDGLIGYFRNVTERKRSEQDIERLNQDLERRNTELAIANRELEAFSYSVSHDLRSPLASIEGFSKLLLQECSSQMTQASQRYLSLIRENTAAMSRLIDDLLAFSRTSRQPLMRQTVSPAELVGQVLEELRGAQIGRRIETIVRDLPPCQADPTLLRQVYINLLSNAIKFTRKREVACIEIGYGEFDGEAAYYVKDNGVGFDASQADRLFGVFQRFHSEDEYEGTGVGLAIVERVIRRHEGRVWAEAEVDKGATFYFTLPPR